MKLADRLKLYDLSKNTYGITTELLVTVEELSELTKEIIKYLRYGVKKNLAEEIADVEIMVEALKHIMFMGDKVEEIKEAKLGRLKKRIEES